MKCCYSLLLFRLQHSEQRLRDRFGEAEEEARAHRVSGKRVQFGHRRVHQSSQVSHLT